MVECHRFDFDHELVAKLVRNEYRPIDYQRALTGAGSYDEGKKVSLFEAPPTRIRALLRHRLSKLRELPVRVAPTVAAMILPPEAV
jgi:hypothetical protein